MCEELGIVYVEPVDIHLSFMDGEPKEGELVIVPECENGKIEVILTTGEGSVKSELFLFVGGKYLGDKIYKI